MKVIASFALVVLLLAAYASGNPGKTDSCQKVCTADYTPLCGKPAQGKGTDITFGNKCVLENYNCEKKDSPYIKATDGECSGKAPVRL